MTQPKNKGTYAFVSLGCPKNLVDSERMLGLLERDGYRLLQDPRDADFVVVNTCGFIDRARCESYDAIREMLALKRDGLIHGVIVAGCLAERQKEALLEEYPDVDYVVGVFGREEIARVADRLLGNASEQRAVFRPAPVRPLDDRDRLRVTPRHYAYLKISEGCDRLCTFCSIPRMRGPHASKPIERVVEEARQLASDGARELVVVAQDTPYYGIDLYGEPRLVELLRELETVDGIDWIRLMYFYPMHVGRELIDAIAGSSRIVPYVDMPLQHANDNILKRMGRRVTRDETERLLDELRARIENLVIRTTFITGFPGETDGQFEELVDFVKKHRFERLGTFEFSREADTPADRLPNQIPEKTARLRRDRLMAVQQEIAFAWNESRVGAQLDVLLDAPVEGRSDAWIGRSYADAPDVDPVVYVTGSGLSVGQIVPSEIVAGNDYDLIAVAVGEPR